eukprot:4140103-Amphidinium_carterae.1
MLRAIKSGTFTPDSSPGQRIRLADLLLDAEPQSPTEPAEDEDDLQSVASSVVEEEASESESAELT